MNKIKWYAKAIYTFVALVVVLGLSLVTTLPVTAGAPELPVDLGTAGDFAIFASSGISTTGTTLITGDIGLGAGVTSTAFTGFSQTLVGAYATSSRVVGKLYAYDYAAPTPAYVNTAEIDMLAAYDDAFARTIPDETELGAGDISGRTLAPGLYKWGTGVLIDDTGVTLEGGADDVWIFQIAQDLTVSNGAHVYLSGGAQAKNIFWAVTGGTTLGTTSVFNGNILCKTLIAMNTGARLNGRALAQTAVTLIANTITAPSGVAPAELVAETGGSYTGTAGSPVSLSGSATGGTPPYTYAWDLDNNGTYETSGKHVSHTWATAGNYTVGLRVTDYVAAADTDTASVNITTAPPPTVGGTAYPPNKVMILAPWIALAAAIIAGATIFLRRRRAQS